MSSALFSRAYVTDPMTMIASTQAGGARAVTSRGRKRRAPQAAIPDQSQLAQALSSSFEEVLRRVLPAQSKADKSRLADMASSLAEQATNTVAGRSVTLQLNRELDSSSRRSVEAFLQSLIHATQNLEPARQ